MRCPCCNNENPADASFCEECGTKLELICPACKVSVSPGARFCKKCGTAIGTGKAAASTTVSSTKSQIIVAAESAASEAIDGERKTVTALFADIKGSTELMEDLDPEEARAIIDPALKLMIDAARRYDGYVVQSTGDGIFALFGAPVAHEDHPQRALYAALRMQDELRRYSAKAVARRRHADPGSRRHQHRRSGGALDHDRRGPRRVHADRAHDQSRFANADAGADRFDRGHREDAQLCEGYFCSSRSARRRVKGVSEPVNVYEVTGLGPLRTRLQRSAGRGLTKFVGREREMEAMKHAAEQREVPATVKLSPRWRRPGTGKSRLFFEFKVKNQSGWMVLEAFSVSHGKASAYLPVIDLLHGYFSIAAKTTHARGARRSTDKVLDARSRAGGHAAIPVRLLGIVEGEDPLAQMDGQVKKRRTLDAIKRILLRESLNQPLMVIFEDLHWIDEETQAFLNLLADSIGTAKILLLVNYRPEYSHQWNSKTYYTQLAARPAGQGERRGDAVGAAWATDRIWRRSSGSLSRRPKATRSSWKRRCRCCSMRARWCAMASVKLTKPISRIEDSADRAGDPRRAHRSAAADAKDLLQTLAVIGREFPLSLDSRGAPEAEEELNRMLNRLASWGVHLRAAGGGRYRIHFQARPYAGGFL